MWCLTAKQYRAYTHTLAHGEYWVSSLRGRMISPTLLFFFPPFHTHKLQLFLFLSLSWKSKVYNYGNQQRWLHNTSDTSSSHTHTHTHTNTHIADIDSHSRARVAMAWKIGTVMMDGRSLFQAAGHHQLGAEEPPFPASRWPLPAPISPGTGPGIQSHGGGGGGRSRLMWVNTPGIVTFPVK